MTRPIKQLQTYLKELKIDGLLLPKMDPHRCEFTHAHDNYLQFVTGFTGSMGFSIVLQDNAAIFVDGRYTLQAEAEVDQADFSHHDYTYKEICRWIQHHMKPKQTMAYDPLLFSERDLEFFRSCCQEVDIQLVAVEKNPIDHIWHDRPRAEKYPLAVHPLEYSGDKHTDKIARICDEIKQSNAQGLFLNTPESIAWLLNIRCPTRAYSPAALCYFYLTADQQGVLFIDDAQVPDDVRTHLGESIAIQAYEDVFDYLSKLSDVMLDPTESPMKAINAIQTGKIVRKTNPCQILKACKNPVEIQGARNAHIRDGVALVNFLAWLYQDGLTAGVTEFDAAQKLLEFRQQHPLFKGVSFDTIAGSGPNGAIVHYRPDEKSSRKLTPHELLLLDSGGQYLDGTTDITRTLSLDGKPSPEQKDRFTRVLKGHIALASAIFPHGTTGSQLDALARQFLWQIGADYAHGTGHGVGSYLGVHEGPQYIASRASTTALEPGMILSNEPGFYKAHEYGIRIESLVVVKPIKDSTYLGFETLSAVPIDLMLIETQMLANEERDWINQYHRWVKKTLMPLVLEESHHWLEQATREF